MNNILNSIQSWLYETKIRSLSEEELFTITSDYHRWRTTEIFTESLTKNGRNIPTLREYNVAVNALIQRGAIKNLEELLEKLPNN